ncbi:MAG: radical SAM protein [Deltaproteobacteria bacterium]|nr:radical SAM protein [Deltaproteobacteria bacterium]
MSLRANPLSPALVREFDRTRSFFARAAICHAPFKSLYFKPRGEVLACCLSDRYELGRYPEQSVMDIWRGARAKDLRRAILRRELPPACGGCRKEIEDGNFTSFSGRWCDGLPYNRKQPTALEFQLGNTCNLECIMCYGVYSSAIRKNRENQPPLQSPYGKDFLEEMGRIIPGISLARFSGGEPFLMDIYYGLWERIIDKNPRCRVRVITNGTVLNRRVRNLLDKAAFDICVSLDSLDPKTYASIRVNAELSQVLENIEWFRKRTAATNRALSVSFCLLRQNFKDLAPVVEYCNQMGAYLSVSPSYYPAETSLRTLSPEALGMVCDHLALVRLPSSNERERYNLDVFNKTANTVRGWLSESLEPAVEVSWEEFRKVAEERFVKQLALESAMLPPDEKNAGTRLVMEKFHAVLDSVSGKWQPDSRHLRAISGTDMTGSYEMFLNLPVEDLKAQLDDLFERPEWWW